MEIAQDNLIVIRNNSDLLKKIIGEELRIYSYDPEIKTQSSQWKTSKESDQPKKECQNQSNVKIMLTVLFDYENVVHHEYASRDQMVKKEYYERRKLRDAMRRKRFYL